MSRSKLHQTALSPTSNHSSNACQFTAIGRAQPDLTEQNKASQSANLSLYKYPYRQIEYQRSPVPPLDDRSAVQVWSMEHAILSNCSPPVPFLSIRINQPETPVPIAVGMNERLIVSLTLTLPSGILFGVAPIVEWHDSNEYPFSSRHKEHHYLEQDDDDDKALSGLSKERNLTTRDAISQGGYSTNAAVRT